MSPSPSVPDVSRVTLSEPRTGFSRPRPGRVRDRASDARTRGGDARRTQVLDAVCLLALREGQFRPGLAAIAAVAGLPRTSIHSLFGSIPLLYRVVARERADAILIALRHHARSGALPKGCDARALAWFVMVGTAPKVLP